jgi:hypothetical protein
MKTTGPSLVVPDYKYPHYRRPDKATNKADYKPLGPAKSKPCFGLSENEKESAKATTIYEAIPEKTTLFYAAVTT